MVSVPLKCVTPVSIPIFQQEEAVRDIKRLCETIAPYEGGIFAPLKLPGKRGDRRSAEVMGEPLLLLLRAFYILCRVFRSVG